ncbi:hypothetical protein M433DRAFT_458200 [Acidomyces richmondensis BFW]|nr:hypothetical protein M433DRAFT_458200 [Acidomyces richmondensis BFW]
MASSPPARGSPGLHRLHEHDGAPRLRFDPTPRAVRLLPRERLLTYILGITECIGWCCSFCALTRATARIRQAKPRLHPEAARPRHHGPIKDR